MRDLIIISSQEFDLDEEKKTISMIVDCFCSYLDFYPVRSNPSKYEIMGPVAKILEMAKNKSRYTEGSMKAKALRKHEMNKTHKASGYVSHEAFAALEKAITNLVSFRNILPEMLIAKVMEMIDGEIYFRERKKVVEKFERIKIGFQGFLEQKYESDLNRLNLKWEKKYKGWSDIPFPSITLKNENGIIRDDIEDFNEKNQEEK